MIERLIHRLAPFKQQLIEHQLYQNIETIPALRCFMESHIYAVWDFMSLVKKLQLDLTTTTIPWQPKQNNSAGRLINEIVWGEETDVDKNGIPMSHFEMYLNAMDQVNADSNGIKKIIAELNNGKNIFDIISASNLPSYISDFLKFTFSIIEEGKTHKIASVFTFGREDLIPDMFISMIKKMNRNNEQEMDQTIYYFERHIEVDGDSHGPLANEMIMNLCGTNPEKWMEATEAAEAALRHRISLWDGINSSILKKEVLYLS